MTFGRNFGKYRPIFKILSLTQIPKETMSPLQGLPPNLTCVPTLPCEIQKSKIMAERLPTP